MDIFRAALLRSYFQIAEIHFSWDRIYIYTYLRIRKFQLSRLNGVKISQFPSRVSILESSTIFSDESVPSVPRNRLFPTFEIRKGRGWRISKNFPVKSIHRCLIQISLQLVEMFRKKEEKKERNEKEWKRNERTNGKVNEERKNERLFPTLATCVPHKGLIYRPVGSHNSVIERIISCGE